MSSFARLCWIGTPVQWLHCRCRYGSRVSGKLVGHCNRGTSWSKTGAALQKRSRIVHWGSTRRLCDISCAWGGGSRNGPGSGSGRRSEGPADDLFRNRVETRARWQRLWQQPFRTLFQDEYFAWSTTGVRHPPTSTAILGLFLIAIMALVIPIFLVLLAVASQLMMLALVVGVPVFLLGAVSFLGLGGLLCISGVALTGAVVMPVLALSGSVSVLAWPALCIASVGTYWLFSRRRRQRVDLQAADDIQLPTPGETSPEESYLQRVREDLAQFDARLYGASAPDMLTETRENTKLPFPLRLAQESPKKIWGVSRKEVERWTERDVAEAAKSFGLPPRVCKWLARELVDGRVVLALTETEQQELVSTVQPRLTFGERKMLKEFLRYLSRAI
jgi:hypothetical protein